MGCGPWQPAFRVILGLLTSSELVSELVLPRQHSGMSQTARASSQR